MIPRDYWRAYGVEGQGSVAEDGSALSPDIPFARGFGSDGADGAVGYVFRSMGVDASEGMMESAAQRVRLSLSECLFDEQQGNMGGQASKSDGDAEKTGGWLETPLVYSVPNLTDRVGCAPFCLFVHKCIMASETATMEVPVPSIECAVPTPFGNPNVSASLPVSAPKELFTPQDFWKGLGIGEEVFVFGQEPLPKMSH